MSEWRSYSLSELADIRISNVDKKSKTVENPVRLCNYMDAYSNDYITAKLEFMESTASPAECTKFKVDKGDVVLTKDSETPDDIGIPSVVIDEIDDLVCGYHLALIKPNREIINPVFLSKQLASVNVSSHFFRMAAGSTRYGLSNGAIAKVKVSIPSLGKQQKIAEILFNIDQSIEKTETLIEKYQHIKAGLMHDLFTRGVTPDGKLRPPREQAPELYQETPIGWIPREWEYSTLKENSIPGIQHLRTGPFGSALKGEHWVNEGHPVITIGSLGEGYFQESELLYVNEANATRLTEFKLKLGDVVFSRVADVGRSVVIEDEQVGWIMSSNLMRISLDRKKIVPEFLQYQLSNDYRLKRQIRCKVNAGGRDVANSDVLNRLIFSCPPFKEQKSIVLRAFSIDTQLQSEQKKLEKLQKQKSGLMHDLLTGKVQVNIGTEQDKVSA